MMKKLTEKDCKSALETGDFAPDLVAGPATAIILTQSWCPQWVAMRAYLPRAEETLKELKIFYVEYDIEPWETIDREAFMAFKENSLNNREIPYVRYYLNGKFSRDSNYLPLDGFISRLS